MSNLLDLENLVMVDGWYLGMMTSVPTPAPSTILEEDILFVHLIEDEDDFM